MIQRKQTLYFIIAAFLLFCCYFVPFAVLLDSVNNTVNMQSVTVKAFFSLSLLTVLAVISILATIFLYKNRNLQKKLSLLSTVLCIILFALELYFGNSQNYKTILGLYGSSVYIGILLPIAACIVNILGVRGVQSDIKLLEESDRLR